MGTPIIRFRDPGECRVMKFTVNKISELTGLVNSLGKTVEFTDAIESGLKLVVYVSGKMSWRHRWTDRATGKKCFFTIGEAPAIHPDIARQVVRDRKTRIAQGLAPGGDPEPQCQTFSAFVKDFLSFAERKYKNMADINSRLRVWLLPYFGKKLLSEIRRADVILFHESVRDRKSAITANRSLALLASIMRRACDLQILDRNPCIGVKKFYEGESRDRALDDGDELSRFMKELIKLVNKGNLMAQAIMLALLTGKRRGELLKWEWSRVNLNERYLTIPGRMTKNKRSDRVELNSKACELLLNMEKVRDKSVDWVFPSKGSKSGHLTEVRGTLKSILRAANIVNFRFHDTRRVHASILINAGADIASIQKILNHGSIKSTMIYSRLQRSTIAKTSELAVAKIEEAING